MPYMEKEMQKDTGFRLDTKALNDFSKERGVDVIATCSDGKDIKLHRFFCLNVEKFDKSIQQGEIVVNYSSDVMLEAKYFIYNGLVRKSCFEIYRELINFSKDYECVVMKQQVENLLFWRIDSINLDGLIESYKFACQSDLDAVKSKALLALMSYVYEYGIFGSSCLEPDKRNLHFEIMNIVNRELHRQLSQNFTVSTFADSEKEDTA